MANQLMQKTLQAEQKNALLDCERIEIELKNAYIADPIFKMWFKRECM